MKITRVRVHGVTTPPRTGGYRSGSGFAPRVDTSVVGPVDTNAGPARSERTMRPRFGKRLAGIPSVARGFIGADPFHVEKINREWDRSHQQPEGAPRHRAPGHHGPGDRAAPCAHLPGGRWPEPVPLRAVRCRHPPRTASLRCAPAAMTATATSSSGSGAAPSTTTSNG